MSYSRVFMTRCLPWCRAAFPVLLADLWAFTLHSIPDQKHPQIVSNLFLKRKNTNYLPGMHGPQAGRGGPRTRRQRVFKPQILPSPSSFSTFQSTIPFLTLLHISIRDQKCIYSRSGYSYLYLSRFGDDMMLGRRLAACRQDRVSICWKTHFSVPKLKNDHVSHCEERII